MLHSDALELNVTEEVVRASMKMGMASVLCPFSFGTPTSRLACTFGTPTSRLAGMFGTPTSRLAGMFGTPTSRLAVCIWSANLQLGSSTELTKKSNFQCMKQETNPIDSKASLHVKRTKVRCVKLELDTPIHWYANHRKRPTFFLSPTPNPNIIMENL